MAEDAGDAVVADDRVVVLAFEADPRGRGQVALRHAVGRRADPVVLDDRALRVEDLHRRAAGAAMLAPRAVARDEVAFAQRSARRSGCSSGGLAAAEPPQDADARGGVADDDVSFERDRS